MKLLVTRTVSFYDPDPWGSEIDVENEAGYINSRVDRLPPRLQRVAGKWYEVRFALRLLRISRKYDGIAVGRYGMWFPVLQRVLGLRKRVVMTDIEWREVKGGRLNRAAALASSAVCCNTKVEIERYSLRYGIPREKFVLVPLAFQRRDLHESSDEGYVFAGGSQGRDWQTLLDAVDGLPYPVEIFTNSKVPRVPSNTTVDFVSRETFYRRMAAASCVVVPLLPEPLRITGTTTWTAAMAMGKVVIVTDPEGARDYMQHGISGFYVRHGDVEGLRQCIGMVMRDPELRKRVGRAAREHAWKEFSPQVFRQRVLAHLAGEPMNRGES